MKKLLTTLFSLLLILVLLPISVTNNEVKAEQTNDDCITFSSDASFTLKTNNTSKNWDGKLWYSTDKTNWIEWNGEAITAAQVSGTGSFYLYVRGNSDNSRITYASTSVSNKNWVLTPSDNNTISCTGNIETLRGATGNNPSTKKMESYCYAYMFYNCTSLTSAPELPATSLSVDCYYAMFLNCINLVTGPSILPAEKLEIYCYGGMFGGCEKLTSTPVIKAKTTANSCCSRMFEGCKTLQTASDLDAEELSENCYINMFLDCTGLIEAPALAATTLAKNCCNGMFEGCTSLKEPADLSDVTTVAYCSCANMFQGCTSLLYPAEMPNAKILAEYCYGSMYLNCTSLLYPADMTNVTTLANHCCDSMYKGCKKLVVNSTSKTGYEKPWNIPNISTASAGEWSNQMLYNTGGDFTSDPAVNGKYFIIMGGNYLTFTANQDNSSVTFNYATCKAGTTVEYNKNNTGWTSYDIQDPKINLNSGDTVSFRGTEVTTTTTNHFVMEGSISASGDVTSLTNGVGGDATLTERCYQYMFENCIALTTAPNLPSKTLKNSCYANMFDGCTNLTTAMSLPATTLATRCYQYMFYGCSSLTNAPSLPATTLYEACYQYMFNGCSSLTSIPNLPATTLVDSCYDSMFYNCSKVKLYSNGVVGSEWKIPCTSTTANNWGTDMFKGTSGTMKGKPDLNTTYYQAQDTQTITFDKSSISKEYGDAAFTNTLSGAKTTVTYESLNTDIATVNSSTGEVTIKAIGSTTIKATAAAESSYGSATASYSLTVTKVKVTLPTAETNLEYNGKTQTGVVLPAEAKYTLKDNTGTDAKTYTATATLSDKTNYEWDITNPTSADQEISWSIAKKTITVTPDSSQNKTYDGSTATGITYTNTGAISGETAKLSGALGLENNAKDAGTHKIVQGTLVLEDNGDFKASNYQITVADVDYTINKKDLIVTPDSDQSKKYDGVTPTTITYDYVGNIPNETPSFTGTLGINDHVNFGTYKIIQNTLDIEDNGTFKKDNYTLSVDDDVYYSITKREVTLTSATDSKNYDGTPLTNTTVTVSGDGFVSVEGAEYTNFTSEKGAEKGITKVMNKFDYSLNKYTSADNYKITVVNGSLTIIGTKKDAGDMDYDIKNGFTASYTVKHASTLTAHIAGKDTSYTVTITENGIDLPAGSYTTTDGSLKINFQPSYLNSLKVGTHILKLNVSKGTDDMDYVVTITVKSNTPTPPYTPVPTGTK